VMGGFSGDQGYSLAVGPTGNVFITGSFAGTADFDPGPGTFNLTASGIADVFVSKLDASGNFVWARAMGGTANDRSHGIALDAAGNVWTTGQFSTTADFDPGAGVVNLTSAGGTDIYISKLDAAGNYLWAGAMGSPSNDLANAIDLDASGNVVTVGNFAGTADFDPGAGAVNLTSAGGTDIFVSMLSPSGSFIWARRFGSTGTDQGNGITVDGNGYVITTGGYSNTVDFDPSAATANLSSVGMFDIFVSALDAGGNYRWAQSMGGTTGNDVGLGITVDASNNVITVGNYYGTADFDPGPGTFNMTSGGTIDIFVSKLVPGGGFYCARSTGTGGGNSTVTAIATDASGNVYATGNFLGTVDFDPGPSIFNLISSPFYQDIFVLKLDVNGNFVWAKAMGGTGTDSGYAIDVDPAGRVYCTGAFNGTADFNPGAATFNLTSAGMEDIFVSALDNNGNFLWAGRMGSTLADYGFGLVAEAGGNVYTTGYFQGTVDFDPGAAGVSILMSAGDSDIFISVLNSGGAYVLAKRMGGIGTDRGYGIALDAVGNIHTTGWFNAPADFDPGAGTATLNTAGISDVFVSKLDGMGNYVWAGSMGGTNNEVGWNVEVDGSGNVYTVGHFNGTADFDPGAGNYPLTSAGLNDAFVCKWGPAGNHVWTGRMGSTGNDVGGDLVLDAAGNVYVAGHFEGTVDFDPGGGVFNLTSYGGSDIYATQWDANGNLFWAGHGGGLGYDAGYAIALGSLYVGGVHDNLTDLDISPGFYEAFGGCGGNAGFIIKLDDGPLAFRDIVLEAVASANVVELSWTADDVAGSTRFIVERLAVDGFAGANYVPGTSFVPIADLAATEFGFVDRNLAPGRHSYRVKGVDLNGEAVLSNVVEVVLAADGGDWMAYPNPLRSGERLLTGLPAGTVVDVFSLHGQMVQSMVLDGAGGCRMDLPAGLYLLRAQGIARGVRVIVE
jgi:hypothetical protein